MRWGLTSDELKNLMLSVGNQHLPDRPLTPVEVASLFHLAMLNGASKQDCACLVHLKGTSMVTRFLSLLKLSKGIRHNVDFEQSSGACIVFTSAFEVSKLDSSDHEYCVKAILEYGFRVSEVKQLVQLRRRSTKSIEECVRQVVALRPTIERRFMFVGAIVDDNLKKRLRSLKQAQRDELIGKIMDDVCPDEDAHSRLGVDRFSLVGTERLSHCLNDLPGGFEEYVISRIASRLINA